MGNYPCMFVLCAKPQVLGQAVEFDTFLGQVPNEKIKIDNATKPCFINFSIP